MSAPWRVTHVITRLILGGAQENTVASVLGLRDKPGFDVDLVSGPTTGSEGSIESHVAAVPGCLTLVPEMVRPVHPWLDLLAYRALLRLFQQRRPHIVHTHSGKAGILGRLAARRARVPIVIHTIHGPSFGPFQGALANLAFVTAERLAGRCSHHFVSVADAMTRQYLAAGIGQPSQYSCIRSGFDLGPFLNARRPPDLARRLGIQPGDFVVGKVARLFRLKGHDELFAALPTLLERVPHARILLVGDGPDRPRYEAMAAQPPLAGRVVFAGLVPAQDVPGHLALMDVLVHLSRREGLPRVLPQALAAGVPIVASHCDGAPEICIDGETGFLVPPDATAPLVDRIAALASNPGLGKALAARGRARVIQEFTTSRMVDDLEALYHDLLQRHGLESGTRAFPGS